MMSNSAYMVMCSRSLMAVAAPQNVTNIIANLAASSVQGTEICSTYRNNTCITAQSNIKTNASVMTAIQRGIKKPYFLFHQISPTVMQCESDRRRATFEIR